MWLLGGFFLVQKQVTVLKRKLPLVLGSVNTGVVGKGPGFLVFSGSCREASVHV